MQSTEARVGAIPRLQNHRTVAYWVNTACAAIALGSAGAANILRAPPVMEGLAHLGYPTYFAAILGPWEVLGAFAIVVPGFSRVKEWAYAGMVFTLSGAAFSHAASGDPVTKILVPLLLLGVVLVSWRLRPAIETPAATESATPRAA